LIYTYISENLKPEAKCDLCGQVCSDSISEEWEHTGCKLIPPDFTLLKDGKKYFIDTDNNDYYYITRPMIGLNSNLKDLIDGATNFYIQQRYNLTHFPLYIMHHVCLTFLIQTMHLYHKEHEASYFSSKHIDSIFSCVNRQNITHLENMDKKLGSLLAIYQPKVNTIGSRKTDNNDFWKAVGDILVSDLDLVRVD